MENLLDAVVCCRGRLSSRQWQRTNFDSVLFSIRFLECRFEKHIGQSPRGGKDSKIPYAIALPQGGGWRASKRQHERDYFRILALVPATICIEMPNTQPMKMAQVQAMCGSSRRMMMPTAKNAVSVARKVPTEGRTSAAS